MHPPQTPIAPFRADHVGSLLRPPELLRARKQHADGAIDLPALRAAEDAAIADAVTLQAEAGLRTATDGEFRRTSWHMDFIYQLRGVSRADSELQVHFRNAAGELEFTSAALAVAGKIGVERTIFGDHFTALQSMVGTAQTPKLTIPSPSMVHYRGGRAAISAEIAGLAELGCTYLQLDDTSLAYLNDPTQRAQLTAAGADGEHQHLRNIKQMNAALAGRPDTLRVTTHLCRGNYRSSWAAEGGYEFVAEALFGELDVDGFFLEFDDARSGGFAPLRFVPKGKQVVLGLVTTKSGTLEDKDVLKRRIDEAAQYVPLDQLCLSPQCGFSSTVEGNALSIDEEKAKLALIVETAAEVWG